MGSGGFRPPLDLSVGAFRMLCDAGSSRGEGFRRGDSAPGLPRGVGRAGGSGSLRSPFVDGASPSLPMVTRGGSAARERLSGAGRRAAQRRRARHHSGSVARERCAAAGPGARPRRAAAVVSGQLFSHRAWGDSCRVPELSALKGLYNMRHSLIAKFGDHLCPNLGSCSRFYFLLASGHTGTRVGAEPRPGTVTE